MITPNASSRIRQRITNDQDTLTLNLGAFAQQIHDGNPQALEALFSPLADRAALDAYRMQFLPDTNKTMYTHQRTIKSFALSGTPKGRRHGLRLARNMEMFMRHGRFNPMLDTNEAMNFTEAANSTPAEYGEYLRALCPTDPFYGYEDSYLERLTASW
jgi:hypothetical protein